MYKVHVHKYNVIYKVIHIYTCTMYMYICVDNTYTYVCMYMLYLFLFMSNQDSTYSSEIGCTGYSESSITESFLSEPSSFHDIDSSQTSIELTFHPFSQVKDCHHMYLYHTVLIYGEAIVILPVPSNKAWWLIFILL